MAADMSDYRDIKKRGGDKVGLLGLFVLTVLAAYFTVALKSAVTLSEPIPLPHTGLSISMPVGNGWHSEKRWMYLDNTFILSSVFALQPGKTTGRAYCQYRWAAKKAPPEDRFEWKASGIDGEIVETARTQAEGLTVDWVRIERPDFLLTTFWGTAELPNGRQLDIEVHQIMSDPELSRRIFNRILTNLKFTDDPLIEAGAEVVTTIKNKGLDTYLDDQKQRTSYLIKDSVGRSIGFTIEFLVDSGKEDPLNVKGASFLYIGGRNTLEQETSFQCSNNLNAFTYGNRIDRREGRSVTQTALDESGIISVKKFGLPPDQKQYFPGSSALPDVFFGHIFKQMLDSDKREIVVDLIDADGKIIPTYITGIESENLQAAYVFDLEILDGRGSSQRVFLDEQRQIYKSLIQQESQYVLERTSAEEILREFPERAPRILLNNQTL
jgi:hypothetical protein